MSYDIRTLRVVNVQTAIARLHLDSIKSLLRSEWLTPLKIIIRKRYSLILCVARRQDIGARIFIKGTPCPVSSVTQKNLCKYFQNGDKCPHNRCHFWHINVAKLHKHQEMKHAVPMTDAETEKKLDPIVTDYMSGLLSKCGWEPKDLAFLRSIQIPFFWYNHITEEYYSVIEFLKEQGLVVLDVRMGSKWDRILVDIRNRPDLLEENADKFYLQPIERFASLKKIKHSWLCVNSLRGHCECEDEDNCRRYHLPIDQEEKHAMLSGNSNDVTFSNCGYQPMEVEVYEFRYA